MTLYLTSISLGYPAMRLPRSVMHGQDRASKWVGMHEYVGQAWSGRSVVGNTAGEIREEGPLF